MGFSLQALISKLGREYRNSPHCHMYHFTLPGKNIQESWSQLEMNHPSYRSHPLHHTNAHSSLEKQGQQTYYWQFCKCESLQAWCLPGTVKLPSFIRIGEYWLRSVPWMSMIWSFKLSQARFPFGMTQSVRWWIQATVRGLRAAAEDSPYYFSHLRVTEGVLYSTSKHQWLGLSSPYKSFRHVVPQEATTSKKKNSSVSNKPKHLLIDFWLLLAGKGGWF